MDTNKSEQPLDGEINIKVLSESLVTLRALLNKATLKGSYDLDEAGQAIACFGNIVKSSEQLEKCQKTLRQLLRSAELKRQADVADPIPTSTSVKQV